MYLASKNISPGMTNTGPSLVAHPSYHRQSTDDLPKRGGGQFSHHHRLRGNHAVRNASNILSTVRRGSTDVESQAVTMSLTACLTMILARFPAGSFRILTIKFKGTPHQKQLGQSDIKSDHLRDQSDLYSTVSAWDHQHGDC